jgi:hypothetical protein
MESIEVSREKPPPEEKRQGLILGVTILSVLFLAVVLTFHTGIWAYIKKQSEGGSCFNMNTWVEGTINLIMHVAIFALFVCLFFFTVVHSVEKLTIYDNLKQAVSSIMNDIEVTLDKPLDLSFDVQLSPALQKSDQETETIISSLTSKAFHVFGMLMAVGLLISGVLYFAMKAYAKKRYVGRKCKGTTAVLTREGLKAGVHYPNLKHIMHHNLVVLGFVFITECFFLFGITLHYRSLDPNAIRKQFIGTLMDLAGVSLEESGIDQSRQAVQGLLKGQATQAVQQQAARQAAQQAREDANRTIQQQTARRMAKAALA